MRQSIGALGRLSGQDKAHIAWGYIRTHPPVATTRIAADPHRDHGLLVVMEF